MKYNHVQERNSKHHQYKIQGKISEKLLEHTVRRVITKLPHTTFINIELITCILCDNIRR